jgi:putative toxin-antitoxin system antitoxin component (TIGR02293 family)
MKGKPSGMSQKRAGTVSSLQKRVQSSGTMQGSKSHLYPVKTATADRVPKPNTSSKDTPKKAGKSLKQTFETSISYWLGSADLKTRIESDFDVINMGEEGITKAAIDDLTAHIGITRKAMAEEVLGLSVKTLERKTPKEKLDKQTSSHAIEIAKIMQHAYEVFEDEEKVKRWMNKENRALNNLKPAMLLRTLTGINMVNDILGRIQEGVYS